MGEVAGAALAGAHPVARLRGAVAVGALGVVFGDIGTSPLYALKEAAKAAGGGSAPTPEAVLGALSLILWSLVVVVSLKYAVLILRADNRGEGGIVALLALLNARDAAPGSWRASLLVVGLIGAALLYGDGAITPGDLGPERGRGAEGRRADARACGAAAHRGHPGGPLGRAAARDRVHRRHLRPGHGSVVRGAGPPRPARHRE